MSFTTQELIECAQRELAMRRTCYPKWAAGKPLTPSKQKEINMMEAIVGPLKSQELDLHMAYTRTEQLANQLNQRASALEIAYSKI